MLCIHANHLGLSKFTFLHYDEANDWLFCHRLDDGMARPEFPTFVEDHFHPMFLKTVNYVIGGLNDLFEQPVYATYGHFDWNSFLNWPQFSHCLNFCYKFYKDIDTACLQPQQCNLASLQWTYLSSTISNAPVLLGLCQVLLIYGQSWSSTQLFNFDTTSRSVAKNQNCNWYSRLLLLSYRWPAWSTCGS